MFFNRLIFVILFSFIFSQELKEEKIAHFALFSPVFKDGDLIPKTFTCEGEDHSVPLHWESAPEETRSFALTCVDPDAPVGDWIHWVAWDIPDSTQELPSGISREDQTTFKQGTNSWGRTGYGGPCPPPGHGFHRYYFTLYALSSDSLNLPVSTRIKELEKSMTGVILDQIVLMGRYERK